VRFVLGTAAVIAGGVLATYQRSPATEQRGAVAIAPSGKPDG
jgi:hypothetical protein